MKSGAYKWVSVSFSTIEFNGVRYLYAQYTDIDQLKKQEQQLEEQYNAAQAFLDSVSNSYLATRRANLTRNTIEAVAGTNPILQVTAQESYDAALAELFKTMPKESDREKYSSMVPYEDKIILVLHQHESVVVNRFRCVRIFEGYFRNHLAPCIGIQPI